jgi:hypothetical protein
MVVGVLPHREGATRITSALLRARRLWPSSCSMAYSTAAMHGGVDDRDPLRASST